MSTYFGVQQIWADGTVLMQTTSPYINYPEDVDPTVLGEGSVTGLGMDASVARQMAQSIDWTSTMLLPIPRDFASYQQVVADGAPVWPLFHLDTSTESAVMWQQGGIVYILSGPTDVDSLISLGNRLR
ncbi:MAG: hypothetical protein R3C44_16640 [Chloroflexota bacterium]